MDRLHRPRCDRSRATRHVPNSPGDDAHLGRLPYRAMEHRSAASALGIAALLRSLRHNPDTGRRVVGRSAVGAALNDIFRALADPNGQVIALHPKVGGTQSLIRQPHVVGRFLTMLDRRGVPLVPVSAFEDGLSDAQSAEQVMPAIAELLPARSCGYMQIRSSWSRRVNRTRGRI